MNKTTDTKTLYFIISEGDQFDYSMANLVEASWFKMKQTILEFLLEWYSEFFKEKTYFIYPSTLNRLLYNFLVC